MGGLITSQDRAFFALFSPLLSFASIFPLPSSLCSPSMVVLVSGVAVKRNRELLDGRWDKHDTKDASNIADLISQGKCLYYDYPEMGLRDLRTLLSLKKKQGE